MDVRKEVRLSNVTVMNSMAHFGIGTCEIWFESLPTNNTNNGAIFGHGSILSTFSDLK